MTVKNWRGFKHSRKEATQQASKLKKAGYRNVKVKMVRHDISKRVLGYDITADNP